MKKKLLAALDRYEMIHPGMKVCVCFSGGADSSALLHAMTQLAKEMRFDLVACHFNHQIRDAEAERDQSFCRRVCESYGVPLYVGAVNVPAIQRGSGKTLEEVARDARYAWFEELADVYSIDRFAMAHHRDDQAETVLFRMIRGTTPKGLAGIPVVRGRYIRPLLDVSKEEIMRYIEEHGVLFVEDSTNLDVAYTRNYIRRVLLPDAKHVNIDTSGALCRLSAQIRDDNDLLESMLPPYCEEQFVDELHDALLRRVICRNFQKKTGNGLCYNHLDKIFSSVKQHKELQCQISKEWMAVYNKGYLQFKRCSEQAQSFPEEGVLRDGESFLYGKKVRVMYENSGISSICEGKSFLEKNVYNLSTEMLFSSDKICGMIRYRMRKPGDYILLKGHHRSIKKLMCDCKIPLELRDIIPVFYDNLGIVCVPFVGVADRVHNPGSRDTAKIQIDVASDCV